mmetsp:Transcript_15709/g.54768  ORF Transcript_15709/g.54768 Transcript_15709/m.54768 type:complete len:354 (+) Transcript_15709:640-1701(+)
MLSLETADALQACRQRAGELCETATEAEREVVELPDAATDVVQALAGAAQVESQSVDVLRDLLMRTLQRLLANVQGRMILLQVLHHAVVVVRLLPQKCCIFEKRLQRVLGPCALGLQALYRHRPLVLAARERLQTALYIRGTHAIRVGDRPGLLQELALELAADLQGLQLRPRCLHARVETLDLRTEAVQRGPDVMVDRVVGPLQVRLKGLNANLCLSEASPEVRHVACGAFHLILYPLQPAAHALHAPVEGLVVVVRVLEAIQEAQHLEIRASKAGLHIQHSLVRVPQANPEALDAGIADVEAVLQAIEPQVQLLHVVSKRLENDQHLVLNEALHADLSMVPAANAPSNAAA